MDSNRNFRSDHTATRNSFDHFNPSHLNHYEMGKPQTYVTNNPIMEQDLPKTSGSFGSVSHARTLDEAPTEAEMNLIRKMRALNGGDYEAQNLGNSSPSNDILSRMGNPTPL